MRGNGINGTLTYEGAAFSQGVCYFYYVDGTEVFTVDSITYTPAPVPLPAAAWTGMSLLGAMGVTAGLRARLRRR